jgi:hypothetical protein
MEISYNIFVFITRIFITKLNMVLFTSEFLGEVFRYSLYHGNNNKF